jgi:hypothetical protein
MNGLIASVLASIPAWGVTALLSGHVDDGTEMIVSFVVWALCFVPLFVWLKRMRDGG